MKAKESIKKSQRSIAKNFNALGLSFLDFPIRGRAGAKTSEANPLKRQRVEHCQRLPLRRVPIKTTRLRMR